MQRRKLGKKEAGKMEGREKRRMEGREKRKKGRTKAGKKAAMKKEGSIEGWHIEEGRQIRWKAENIDHGRQRK